MRHASRRPGRTARALPALAALLALLLAAAGCYWNGPPGTKSGCDYCGCSPTSPSDSSGKAMPCPDFKQIFTPLDSGPGADGDVGTLDPALVATARDADKAQMIFPPLVTLDGDLSVIPWAATALPDVSADGTTYTFHLHLNMRWSDGVPIDASTYAYALNRSLDSCTGAPAWGHLADLRGAPAFRARPCPAGAASQPASANLTDGPAHSVVVADPLTLVLALDHPAAYFLAALTSPAALAQPEQLIERYGKAWTGHLADGTGFGGNLFKVGNWTHGPSYIGDHSNGRLGMTRNDAFSWRGAKPKLRGIDWMLYKDPATLWADYKAGKGDLGYPTADGLADARAQLGYTETPALALRFLRVNWGAAPFDDLRVRRAFDLAFDRAALTHEVPGDAALPTYHMLVRGLPGYQDRLEDPAGRSGGAALAADVADARGYARSYADERCGGAFAGCPPVRLLVPAGSAAEAARGRFLVAAWRAAFPGWRIGVDAPEERGGPSPLACPQLCTDAWAAEYPDPHDALSPFVRTGAAYNRDGVSLPAADALLDRADVEPDRASRLGLYRRAEQAYVDQVARMPWGQAEQVYQVRPTITGVAIGADGRVALPTWQSASMAP